MTSCLHCHTGRLHNKSLLSKDQTLWVQLIFSRWTHAMWSLTLETTSSFTVRCHHRYKQSFTAIFSKYMASRSDVTIIQFYSTLCIMHCIWMTMSQLCVDAQWNNMFCTIKEWYYYVCRPTKVLMHFISIKNMIPVLFVLLFLHVL